MLVRLPLWFQHSPTLLLPPRLQHSACTVCIIHNTEHTSMNHSQFNIFRSPCSRNSKSMLSNTYGTHIHQSQPPPFCIPDVECVRVLCAHAQCTCALCPCSCVCHCVDLCLQYDNIVKYNKMKDSHGYSVYTEFSLAGHDLGGKQWCSITKHYRPNPKPSQEWPNVFRKWQGMTCFNRHANTSCSENYCFAPFVFVNATHFQFSASK